MTDSPESSTTPQHATLELSAEVLLGPGGWTWKALSGSRFAGGVAASQVDGWERATAWLVSEGSLPSRFTATKADVLCGCRQTCGDDGDIDGPGTCKGLPQS